MVKLPLSASEQFIGRINSKTLEIELNEAYSESMMEETFIHEVIHAIDIICDLDLEENQVAPLAALMHQFIQEVE